jgi:type IV secretion system protein VirB6
MACVAPQYGDPFLTGILDYIDCETLGIASGGYQALASPAAIGASLLLAALTLFVAGLGLRMLAGHGPSLGDVTLMTLKVGIVLTLATSWIAHRDVIFEPVLRGPAEIAATIGRSAGLEGTDGSFVDRLQATDDALVRLSDLGAGRLDRGLPPSNEAGARPEPARAPLADDLAFGLARIAFLGGVIGTLGIVRLVGGIALALTPVFAGLLLFEATRGVFLGWLRIIVATAIGALFAALVLAVELGFLLPWLESTIKLRESFYATTAAPIELMAITLSFAIITFATVGFAVRLALFAPSASWSAHIVRLASNLAASANQRVDRPPQWARDEAQPANDRVAHIVAALRPPITSTSLGSAVRAQDIVTRQDGNRSGRTSDQTDRAVPLGQRYRSTASRVVAPAAKTRAAS